MKHILVAIAILSFMANAAAMVRAGRGYKVTLPLRIPTMYDTTNKTITIKIDDMLTCQTGFIEAVCVKLNVPEGQEGLAYESLTITAKEIYINDRSFPPQSRRCSIL